MLINKVNLIFDVSYDQVEPLRTVEIYLLLSVFVPIDVPKMIMQTVIIIMNNIIE